MYNGYCPLSMDGVSVHLFRATAPIILICLSSKVHGQWDKNTRHYSSDPFIIPFSYFHCWAVTIVVMYKHTLFSLLLLLTIFLLATTTSASPVASAHKPTRTLKQYKMKRGGGTPGHRHDDEHHHDHRLSGRPSGVPSGRYVYLLNITSAHSSQTEFIDPKIKDLMMSLNCLIVSRKCESFYSTPHNPIHPNKLASSALLTTITSILFSTSLLGHIRAFSYFR